MFDVRKIGNVWSRFELSGHSPFRSPIFLTVARPQTASLFVPRPHVPTRDATSPSIRGCHCGASLSRATLSCLLLSIYSFKLSPCFQQACRKRAHLVPAGGFEKRFTFRSAPRLRLCRPSGSKAKSNKAKLQTHCSISPWLDNLFSFALSIEGFSGPISEDDTY